MEIEKITPFAIALAEALSSRAVYLDALKDIRRNGAVETAEGLMVTKEAYSKSKRRVRKLLATYNNARNDVLTGKEPKALDDEEVGILRLHGWKL